MKIAVIGYSGSGKSTLAEYLGKRYHADVLYLDTVHWLPGWTERERGEAQEMVKEYLDTHDAWVIDGNYSALSYDRRMAEADQIIWMKFGRIPCLYRVWKRNRHYKGRSRASMTQGCPEKMDAEFVRWILWKGRSGQGKKRCQRVRETYPEKVTVLKNQRELDRFYQALAGPD